MNLDALKLFQLIVEKGSLAAAGRELRISATTVSDRLVALESYFGVTLLNRTTRSISLTEEGRMLIDGSRNLLADAVDLENRVRLGAQTLSGHIRISAPVDLGLATIKPVIDTFLSDNPNTSIELLLSDGYINLVDEGIDMAVRYGELSDSTLLARKIAENRRLVCASPDYLKTHGKPFTPQDLEKHNCLVMRFGIHLDNIWRFKADGKDLQVQVKGNRISNDGRLVREWCLSGYGIVLKSQWDVGDDIEAGNLTALLSDHSPPPSSIHLLFPPSRTRPHRVNELAKKIAQAFEI